MNDEHIKNLLDSAAVSETSSGPFTEEDFQKVRERISSFAYRPKISPEFYREPSPDDHPLYPERRKAITPKPVVEDIPEDCPDDWGGLEAWEVSDR